MALDHVFKSNHIVQISLEKIKTKSVLSHAQKHNEREAERLGGSTGDHIDARREQYNETIVSTLNKTIWQTVVSKVTGLNISDAREANTITQNELRYADGHKVKSDAVLAFEAEAGYPGDLMWHKINDKGEAVPINPEDIVDENSIRCIEEGGKGYFLFPADKDEFQKWIDRTVEFLSDTYGADNLVSVEVHMDEAKPHLHALLTPSYVDDKGITRFSFRRVSEGPDGTFRNFRNLQTAYAEKFSDMGYKRGEEYSINKHYSDRDEARAIAAKVLASKLPEDRAEAEEAYKVALARKAELELELSHKRDKGKAIPKLIEKNKQLEDELAKARIEIEKLQAENVRRECELMGMRKHPDQEMIRDIYTPLQENLVEIGSEIYKRELGINVESKLPKLKEEETEL